MHKPEIYNSLEKYGIEVISSDNSEFDLLLSDYFCDDAESLAFLEPLKQVIIFVKNKSSKHLCTIAANWIFYIGGEEYISRSGAINFGFIHSRKPVPPERVKSYAEIPSGGIKFYSFVSFPFDVMKNSLEFKEKGGSYSGSYTVSLTGEPIYNIPPNLILDLDAALFADGEFIGADRTFLFETISGILQAERDFAAKMLNLREKGVSDGEIVKKAQAAENIRNLIDKWGPKPPQNAEEAFKRSYDRTFTQLKETVYRQKNSTQLTDAQIVNMSLEYSERANFPIRKVD